MTPQITQRIEAWHADRYLREFDSNVCSRQLYHLFYDEWGAHSLILHMEFEILGKLFFMSIGNLWKLNTPPEQYENAIEGFFGFADSGPFGNRQPVDTAIEWIVGKIHSGKNEDQVREYSLVLLDAILELYAVNCKRSQTEAILSTICDYMDYHPKGEPCPDHYFVSYGITELSESLKEIANNSGKTQYEVIEPGIWQELPEKVQE